MSLLTFNDVIMNEGHFTDVWFLVFDFESDICMLQIYEKAYDVKQHKHLNSILYQTT